MTVPWGQLELQDGGDRTIDVGPLQIVVRLTGPEVWVSPTPTASDRDGAGRPSGPPSTPKDAEWQRFAVAEQGASLAVLPCFPDRTLVVEPDRRFHLVPGATARIFVGAPVWVRLTLLDEDRTVLWETPTEPLSDTWFGDTSAGELCYWLPTAARRSVDASAVQPHLCLCPLTLRNESSELLPVERIAVHTAQLPIFSAGETLWAPETVLRYEARDEGSRIESSDSPPPEAQGGTLLADARRSGRGRFRAPTFARLRSLSGF